MRYGVLGTGTVGRTLAGKLAELGHEVRIGSRTAGEDTVEFADAAAFGEVVVNATAGAHSLEVLRSAGAESLDGKLLIEVANPLDFSHGMPPVLAFCNDTSLGEQIQDEFPGARVVKTLNTVNAGVMVDPALVGGDTDVFVCGNDDGAKEEVSRLLGDFGWKRVLDLGDITAARATEMYLILWLRLFQSSGTPHVNVKVVAGE
jgi:predicted dinucleotide-binding enzyme